MTDTSHHQTPSGTPETDALIDAQDKCGIGPSNRIRELIHYAGKLERERNSLRDKYINRCADMEEYRKQRDELLDEVNLWKDRFVMFAIVHAAQWGRDHYGEGYLHPTHYNLLQEAGARLVDFKKGGVQ